MAILSIISLSVVPYTLVKNYIFSTKEEEMTALANNYTNTLSLYGDYFSDYGDDIYQLLDLSENSQVIVTDSAANVVYNSSKQSEENNIIRLNPQIINAINGKKVFKTEMDNNHFVFSIAVPIIFNESDEIKGCVYIRTENIEQAKQLYNVRNIMISITCIMALIISITIVLMFKKSNKQINEMYSLINKVKSGIYDEKADIFSKDELGWLTQEFNELANKLWEIEDKRRRFVSDASHELKTPLASLKLLSEYILTADNVSMDTVKEIMTDINTEIDRLIRVSERLIKITKIDSKQEIILSKICVNQVISDVVKLLMPIALEDNIVIKTNLCEDVFVYANYDGLFEIIFNIAENAVKYNRKNGSVNIKLKTEENSCIVAISDTGYGIETKNHKRIFDRFYRVDEARASDTGGTGLGLSVVKEMLKIFNGSVFVESTINKGSTFTVTLPVYVKRNGDEIEK